ncbi:hypothetical protein Dimus_011737 [Dionaea muscipula]
MGNRGRPRKIAGSGRGKTVEKRTPLAIVGAEVKNVVEELGDFAPLNPSLDGEIEEKRDTAVVNSMLALPQVSIQALREGKVEMNGRAAETQMEIDMSYLEKCSKAEISKQKHVGIVTQKWLWKSKDSSTSQTPADGAEGKPLPARRDANLGCSAAEKVQMEGDEVLSHKDEGWKAVAGRGQGGKGAMQTIGMQQLSLHSRFSPLDSQNQRGQGEIDSTVDLMQCLAALVRVCVIGGSFAGVKMMVQELISRVRDISDEWKYAFFLCNLLTARGEDGVLPRIGGVQNAGLYILCTWGSGSFDTWGCIVISV